MLSYVTLCACLLVDMQIVTCSRYGIEKTIEGIQGFNIFKQYENQCRDEKSVVLKYGNCHVEYLELNVTRIRMNFSKLRTILVL